jgi:hypothetical protein
MNFKELKQKAEAGDAIACYELGLTYKGKNYNNMLKWLHESAKKGHRPAIVELAELYTSKRSLIERLDEEACADLNDFACSLINENNEESKKIAYTFFRVASKYNNDALQSLAYCKFEGIGVKKNIKDAFDILYVNKLGNELTVLKSNISEGIPYQPQKSKVAKNVKRKHQKKALSEVARNIFLYIFALPAFLIFGFVIDNEYKIKNAGGYEVDEALRGNAMGGALLTILACIAWPYFLCSACSALVVYLAGMEEGYWKWGFIIGILPTLIIYWIFSKINLKSYFK